ncbi:hypothetical protein CC80DRAFT_318855 [Byssothecium circinans]|uniref:Uncharacterized protein n=1 Tax=Byssothecium circinans TaxID=147558 RepID=A0A6A5U317_9PLEO|nr:hypothetical protein CC80DRAFT_318855 [Byssothecium circinans]
MKPTQEFRDAVALQIGNAFWTLSAIVVRDKEGMRRLYEELSDDEGDQVSSDPGQGSSVSNHLPSTTSGAIEHQRKRKQSSLAGEDAGRDSQRHAPRLRLRLNTIQPSSGQESQNGEVRDKARVSREERAPRSNIPTPSTNLQERPAAPKCIFGQESPCIYRFVMN